MRGDGIGAVFVNELPLRTHSCTAHILLVRVTIESIVVGVKSNERDELLATARRKSGNECMPPRVLAPPHQCAGHLKFPSLVLAN
jgi:hypothetical protein